MAHSPIPDKPESQSITTEELLLAAAMVGAVFYPPSPHIGLVSPTQ